MQLATQSILGQALLQRRQLALDKPLDISPLISLLVEITQRKGDIPEGDKSAYDKRIKAFIAQIGQSGFTNQILFNTEYNRLFYTAKRILTHTFIGQLSIEQLRKEGDFCNCPKNVYNVVDRESNTTRKKYIPILKYAKGWMEIDELAIDYR